MKIKIYFVDGKFVEFDHESLTIKELAKGLQKEKVMVINTVILNVSNITIIETT